MLVGAGTVLTVEQVQKAVDAGARFIVSPGLNPEVVKYCVDRQIPVTPGTCNPSDIEAAIDLGLDVVKFFPAEAAGGLAMIKAVAAPYTKMKFMPTGGINAGNLNQYLAFPKILACGGSWMVSKDLVKAGAVDKIRDLTREAVMTMLGFELKHVGVNCKDEAEAEKVAGAFESLFGFARKKGNSSVFAGTALEAMKSPYLGEKGHIAIGTNSVKRAIHYLEGQGYEFDYSTAKYKGDQINAIYLKKEVGGFAVHLVQKA